jgi:hypothetical protein
MLIAGPSSRALILTTVILFRCPASRHEVAAWVSLPCSSVNDLLLYSALLQPRSTAATDGNVCGNHLRAKFTGLRCQTEDAMWRQDTGLREECVPMGIVDTRELTPIRFTLELAPGGVFGMGMRCSAQ